jgi:hypothetical protein
LIFAAINFRIDHRDRSFALEGPEIERDRSRRCCG